LNEKIELLKKPFDNSWLAVTSKFNATIINVFVFARQDACIVLAGDELEENMQMILLPLIVRVEVGK
jgi:hypothetical protein